LTLSKANTAKMYTVIYYWARVRSSNYWSGSAGSTPGRVTVT